MCFGKSLELFCSHSFIKFCCLEIRDYRNPLFLCSWGGEGPQAYHKSARKNKRRWLQKEAAGVDSQRSGCSLQVRARKDIEHRSPGKQIFSAERSPCDRKAANLHKRRLPTWAWTCRGEGWWWMTQLLKMELLTLFVIRIPGILLIQAAFQAFASRVCIRNPVVGSFIYSCMVHVWCVSVSGQVHTPKCVHAEARTGLWVSSSIFPHLIALRQDLSLNWKIVVLGMAASELLSSSCLCPLPRC